MSEPASPAYWPARASLAASLLKDMLEGYSVWIPANAPADRVIAFNAAILTLRSIGWPLVAQHGPVGLQYMLPDETRERAIHEIHRLAAANMG